MASSGVAESENPPDDGAKGRVGEGTVICAGAAFGEQLTFEDNPVVEFNMSQQVNVTFPTLPTDVQAPFNMTVNVFAPGEAPGYCNVGWDTLPRVINQSWFLWDSKPLSGAGDRELGQPGDTFIFDIHRPIPDNPNAHVDFWVSSNYTMHDSNNGAGFATLAPMAPAQLIPTFLLVALFFFGLTH